MPAVLWYHELVSDSCHFDVRADVTLKTTHRGHGSVLSFVVVEGLTPFGYFLQIGFKISRMEICFHKQP